MHTLDFCKGETWQRRGSPRADLRFDELWTRDAFVLGFGEDLGFVEPLEKRDSPRVNLGFDEPLEKRDSPRADLGFDDLVRLNKGEPWV